MARQVPLVLILVAAVLVLGAYLAYPPAARAGTAGGPPGHNDAASGSDAGDSPEQALLLDSARRMWSANLTPAGTDSDWYRLRTGEAFCALADATLTTPGALTLAGSASRDPGVSRGVGPHEARQLALAAPAGHVPLFGVEPTAMLMAADGSNVQSPGRYTFALRSLGLAELDPEGDGEGPDAGATLATAAPLPAGCAAGRIEGGAGDLEDQYFFDVAGSRHLTLSFAVASGDDATVRIVRPSGTEHSVLRSGESVDVLAGEDGRWRVIVAATSPATLHAPRLPVLLGLAATEAEVADSTYLLGVTDGPGDPQACRPHCWR